MSNPRLRRAPHEHLCLHVDRCYRPKADACPMCQSEAFQIAMLRRRYEDSLTTEQLLARRA